MAYYPHGLLTMWAYPCTDNSSWHAPTHWLRPSSLECTILQTSQGTYSWLLNTWLYSSIHSSSTSMIQVFRHCIRTSSLFHSSYAHRDSFLSGFSQSLMWSEMTFAAWSAVKFRPIASTKSPSGSGYGVSQTCHALISSQTTYPSGKSRCCDLPGSPVQAWHCLVC